MIRELKNKYTPEIKKAKSLPVLEQVEQEEHFQKAQVVLAYWSMEDEVFTHDFVCKWAKEKTLLLPCVRGNELDIRYFDGRDKLCPGEGFAIPEPIGQLFTELDRIDVVLVPGVAFDSSGNRLGRGKGYYDRILRQTKKAYKIGICFDFQLLEQVPVENHDVVMDRVLNG